MKFSEMSEENKTGEYAFNHSMKSRNSFVTSLNVIIEDPMEDEGIIPGQFPNT